MFLRASMLKTASPLCTKDIFYLADMGSPIPGFKGKIGQCPKALSKYVFLCNHYHFL